MATKASHIASAETHLASAEAILTDPTSTGHKLARAEVLLDLANAHARVAAAQTA